MQFTMNVATTFITRVLQLVLRLLGGIVAARFLGPSALGSYSLMQMVAGVAVTLGNLGVNGAIVYHAGKEKNAVRPLAANALVLGFLQGILLMALVAALLPVIKLGLKDLKDIDPLLWLIPLAGIPFQLLIMNFNALLQGQNLIAAFNRNNLVLALINFACILLFVALVKGGLAGRLLAYTTGCMLGAAAAFYAVRGLYKGLPGPSIPLAKKMLRFGSMINAITVIQFLNYRLDMFILGCYRPAAEVGHYFVSVTLGELLWYLPNAIGVVLFPILAGGGNGDSRLTARAARNNLLMVFLAAVVVFAGAELVIGLLFSSAYLPAASPLRALLPGIVVFSLAKILSPDLISRGMARTVAAISLVSLVINVALNLLLVPGYGATGAALASTISYACAIVALLTVYCRATGYPPKDILVVNTADIRAYLELLKRTASVFREWLRKAGAYEKAKRCLDVLFSAALLVFLLPVMLLVAAVVIFESGWPPLFVQERAGRYGRPFKIYKFRTMYRELPFMAGIKIDESLRITRAGRFLRATGIDEFPQLLNVLKGDMSLVGPRPTLPYQVEKYDARQRLRLSVRPGMTGWAQVGGGELRSWRERIEMDLWYIENRTLLLDLKIMFRTLRVMLKKRRAWIEQSRDPLVAETSGEDRDAKGVIPVKKLVIVGAGGCGREVLQLVNDINKVEPEWDILGFVDDNPDLQGKTVNGLPVLGGLEWLASNAGDKYSILALGEPRLKRKAGLILESSGVSFATLVHPSAVVGDSVVIGPGSIITAGVVLTVNITLGRHVIVNIGSVVSHDAVVGDYTTIAVGTNIMGGASLGEGCYVASGATVRDGVTIGRDTIIGLGAVVVGDLPGEVVAVGCPARVVRDNKDGKVFR